MSNLILEQIDAIRQKNYDQALSDTLKAITSINKLDHSQQNQLLGDLCLAMYFHQQFSNTQQSTMNTNYMNKY